jgi:hypothetical protein
MLAPQMNSVPRSGLETMLCVVLCPFACQLRTSVTEPLSIARDP